MKFSPNTIKQIVKVATTEINGFPAPIPIPIAKTKKTKAISRGFRTTVRNRIMDNAPTKLKARATLSPITTITTVINIDRRIKDSMKDLLAIRLCVQR